MISAEDDGKRAFSAIGVGPQVSEAPQGGSPGGLANRDPGLTRIFVKNHGFLRMHAHACTCTCACACCAYAFVHACVKTMVFLQNFVLDLTALGRKTHYSECALLFSDCIVLLSFALICSALLCSAPLCSAQLCLALLSFVELC